MVIIKKGADLHHFLQENRRAGKQIGFVPTMGALHAGHLALVRAALQHDDLVVCSIFVNPAQFNDPADFQKYPNTLGSDIPLLEQAGADVLFLPEADEIYPHGWKNLERYDLGYLEQILEGRYRPGHFQGVCQVMSRLLRLTAPDILYMGQKDYQQCLVVRRLLELQNIPTQFVASPTVREPDGLAMSSRNLRLSPEERHRAPHIFRILTAAAQAIRTASADDIRERALREMVKQGFRPDYLEIARALDLREPVPSATAEPLVIVTAAFLGEVRLIDNIIVE